jgi:hypothetical protein
MPTNIAHEARQLEEAPDSVVVQFRYDQQNSGVSRHGHLHAGGRLKIEYDPARLVRAVGPETSITEILCHARFQPSGEQQSGALVPPANPMQRQTVVTRPLIYEVQIPAQTERVEVWFEARASADTAGWDSRYGRNFTFAVTDEGLAVPEQSVTLRPNAVVDPARIHVVEDAASKEQVGLGSSGTRLQTALVIRAHISEASRGPLEVWADLHVFDAVGDLLHAASIALEPSAQLSADSELRLWDAEVYPGSGGASGMGVWSRPDAHTINYRLYCKFGDQLFTDGVLHQFEVPADTEVRPIPGGW